MEDHSHHHHQNAMEMNESMMEHPIMHSHEGHDNHSSSKMGHDMMKMYFHGGCTEVILFDFWRIETICGLIGSMIACFVLGMVYEALKFYKESWMRGSFTSINRQPTNRLNIQRKSPSDENSPNSSQTSAMNDSVNVVEAKMFSVGHGVLTCLHLVQVTLAYFLMLIVMTYNSWLCAATIWGTTVGYFLFGWRKTSIVDVSDHCQ